MKTQSPAERMTVCLVEFDEWAASKPGERPLRQASVDPTELSVGVFQYSKDALWRRADAVAPNAQHVPLCLTGPLVVSE